MNPDQLALSLDPDYDEAKPERRNFEGLEGLELDRAWFAAGSPLPVPYGCIPLPFSVSA